MVAVCGGLFFDGSLLRGWVLEKMAGSLWPEVIIDYFWHLPLR